MGRLAIGLVCAALAAGCGKSDDKKDSAKAKPPGPAPTKPATPADAAVKAAAPATPAPTAPATGGLTAKTVTELPAVTEVPPLTLTHVKWKKHRESKKLNSAGYKLHKAKKLEEAAAKYAEAVKLDPFNLLSRYNLASIWVQTGKPGKALRLLSQYDKPDCEVCQGILIHARGDKEWAAFHQHPVFLEITKHAKIGLARTVVAGADAFEKSISKNKVTKKLAPYIHPHRAIDADGRNVQGIQELNKWIRKATPDDGSGYYSFFTVEERQGCDAKCCRYRAAPSDTAASLTQLCFKKMPGGPLVLTKIGMYEYMRGMGE